MVSILANEWAQGNAGDIHLINFTNLPDAYPLDPRIKRFNALKQPNVNVTILSYLFIGWRIRKYIRRNKIKHVFTFLDKFNILVIGALLLTGTSIFACERNSPWRKRPMWIRLSKRALYPFAECVVVQTERAIPETQKQTGASRIVCIPNPVRQMNYGHSDVCQQSIILSVGRLTDQKNHALLINAFALANLEGWQLVIVGDGSLRETLLKMRSSRGLESKVLFAGQTADVASWYSQASIFCLTSEYEGFPNVLLEAMSFGLCCIATDCDIGPRELLRDGVAGKLVPVGDVGRLCDALRELAGDSDKRQRLGARAKLISQDYSSSVIAARFLKVLTDSATSANQDSNYLT